MKRYAVTDLKRFQQASGAIRQKTKLACHTGCAPNDLPVWLADDIKYIAFDTMKECLCLFSSDLGADMVEDVLRIVREWLMEKGYSVIENDPPC